jgi:hypothetical protein
MCLNRPDRDEVRSRLVMFAASKIVCANPCHAVYLEYLPIINIDPSIPSLESSHAILCLDRRRERDLLRLRMVFVVLVTSKRSGRSATS